MELTVYGFEGARGAEDSYTTQDYRAATERARRYNMRLIAHTFEWSESEVIEDNTQAEEA